MLDASSSPPTLSTTITVPYGDDEVSDATDMASSNVEFDAALLTTLMNAQSVDRMVVGHNIVSEPHYVSVSPIPSRKLDVLFLDIGMSHQNIFWRQFTYYIR